ncbi:hypothetical protein LCGC14_0422320 [marine sediment metagenome]|uniref:Uncharacterized protein n=1 Tax=marine sediment metagenome TaxID=412755 RepID=A0A0F9T8P6_9ZZZZ
MIRLRNIIILALILKISLLLVLNIFIFNWQPEHEDTVDYIHDANTYAIFRGDPNEVILPYNGLNMLLLMAPNFIHTKLTATQPLPFIVASLLITSFTIMVSLLTIRLAYKITPIAGILLALDPYLMYLSITPLKDTLLVFAAVLLIHEFLKSHRRESTSVFSAILTTGLRVKLGIALGIIFLIPTILRKRYKEAFFIVLGLIVIAVVFPLIGYETGLNLLNPSKVLVAQENPLKSSRTDFFEERPTSTWLAPVRFMLEPYPFSCHWSNTGCNLREQLFSLYMTYWLLIAPLAFYILKRETVYILLSVILLGTVLAATTESITALMRWRMPLFAMLEILAGVSTHEYLSSNNRYARLRTSLNSRLAARTGA